MPTEKGMYVMDTDASVVAISDILHQEEKMNERIVLRPIAYGSKVFGVVRTCGTNIGRENPGGHTQANNATKEESFIQRRS